MASSAESIDDAENGLNFMQDMIEFMRNTNSLEASTTHHIPLTVIPLLTPSLEKPISFPVATAQFGKQLHGTQGVNKYFVFNLYILLFLLLFRYLLKYILFNHLLLVQKSYFLIICILVLVLLVVVIVYL